MGIQGLWEEIEQRKVLIPTTAAEESAKCYAKNNRPLRVAVDASILIFKAIGTTQGLKHGPGINHPVKLFMTHALNILCDGIQAVFVFDGPGRPPCKRGKSRPNSQTPRPYIPPHFPDDPSRDLIQEYSFGHVTMLSKEVLRLMGISHWDAPGEAEAECAELEKHGIVDAVLTTDGDALAFGARCVLRLPKNKKSGSNSLDLEMVMAADLETAGISISAFPLVAILSGGDYNNGLLNCGPKIALRIMKESRSAARLSNIARSDKPAAIRDGMLSGWKRQRDIFIQEIRKISPAVANAVPKEFPDFKVLDYYYRPVVSDEATMRRCEDTIWHRPVLRINELREFASRNYLWCGRDRARQFLSRLTPGLLARELLIAGSEGLDRSHLVSSVTYKRQQSNSKSKFLMVKVTYLPLKVALIDYDAEPIVPGCPWDEEGRKDPKRPYEVELPEFLVRYGAASSLPQTGSKRKSNNSENHAREPKKRRMTTQDDKAAVAPLQSALGSPAGSGVEDNPGPVFRKPRESIIIE